MSNKILDLKLTYRCNNNCVYCCQDRELRKLNSDLSLNYIKQIVASELPINKVVLTGGEPTMNSHFIKIIEYLAQNKIGNIQLQTNARTLRDKNLLNTLVTAGVNSFGISMHGYDAHTHEAFTNTEGSFYELVEALHNIRNFDIPVALNCVITKHNIHCLDKIFDFVARNNFADTLQYAFIHITGNAKTKVGDYVSISTAANAIKKVISDNMDMNLKVFTEAIPFCVMTNYEKNIAELYNNDIDVVVYDFHEKKYFRDNIFKYKPSSCQKCLFNSICCGTWKEYFEIFGAQEFIPVREFRSKTRCL
jgi:hypothetical protein